MTQYIDKDALVTEIERRRDLHYKYYMKNGAGSISECKYDEDRDILSFINTLEVKDVDLDEEITDYINRYYHIRFDETLERGNDPLTTIDFEEIVKYFFELGIKVQKGGDQC